MRKHISDLECVPHHAVAIATLGYGNISMIQQRLSGVFSLGLCKFRDERPCDNFKKTAIGGNISHLWRNYLRLFYCLAGDAVLIAPVSA